MTTTTLALGRSAHIGEIAERERKLRELEWVCVMCARNPNSTRRRMAVVGTIIAEQHRRRSRVPDNAHPHYREAAVVGGGVIGVSWSALFLAHGLGVTVADPLPDIADRVRAGLRDRRRLIASEGAHRSRESNVTTPDRYEGLEKHQHALDES